MDHGLRSLELQALFEQLPHGERAHVDGHVDRDHSGTSLLVVLHERQRAVGEDLELAFDCRQFVIDASRAISACVGDDAFKDCPRRTCELHDGSHVQNRLDGFGLPRVSR